jgi:hypothetical protein
LLLWPFSFHSFPVFTLSTLRSPLPLASSFCSFSLSFRHIRNTTEQVTAACCVCQRSSNEVPRPGRTAVTWTSFPHYVKKMTDWELTWQPDRCHCRCFNTTKIKLQAKGSATCLQKTEQVPMLPTDYMGFFNTVSERNTKNTSRSPQAVSTILDDNNTKDSKFHTFRWPNILYKYQPNPPHSQ